ncbi:AAA family ATPase [Lonepinella sp. MS14437]|uniref:AAA family ATPase n=1 Tax=Lonepinella sp. MS14437 TaxID=3003620 RepID=UPI0036DDA271
MKFRLLNRNEKFPDKPRNLVCLIVDDWNDHSYKTLFQMTVFDEIGNKYHIGDVKIGFENQKKGILTFYRLQEEFDGNMFDSLPENFFSLGQDTDFYVQLCKLPANIKQNILTSLNDVVYKEDLFRRFEDEPVMNTSLLRFISKQTVKEQFRRILEDKSPLCDFNFSFVRGVKENIEKLELEFNVLANSKPSTNIHAIIGRNGVGKTTLLNGMIKAFLNKNDIDGAFYEKDNWNKSPSKIGDDYFTHLVAVSFSVFDSFFPNKEEINFYSYIGLKEDDLKLKEPAKYFEGDFWKSFDECRSSSSSKKERWLNAIRNLASDDNFAEMKLENLMDESYNKNKILEQIKRMSSGHASVLLILTQLVAKVEEKTLVLLDEPESHLHPPLLSAFIRALSDLLDNRNGIAIIATHSPVVLQEIPKSCVWKLVRTGTVTNAFRLVEETFGENVGVLTREVFGLEVEKSGFNRLLNESVAQGKTYEQILESYDDQLGREGRLLLRTLIRLRDEKNPEGF